MVIRFILLSLLSLGLVFPALAQSMRPSEVVEVSIRPGWMTDRGTYMAGLHLKLAPGWMTYWRHPGESGLVPRIDTRGSDNLDRLVVHWPEPKVIESSGARSLGYTEEVVFPLEITPSAPGGLVQFNAEVQIGVCREVCIPVDFSVNTVFNGAGAHDALLAASLARRPRTASAAGLRQIDCSLSPDSGGMQVDVRMQMPQTGMREFMLIELPGAEYRMRGNKTRRDGDILQGTVRLSAKGGAITGLDRSQFLITVLNENGAVTHRGCSLN